MKERQKAYKSIGLEAFIDKYYQGNRSAFARNNNTTRQQVNLWLNEMQVIILQVGKNEFDLYSRRREIKN